MECGRLYCAANRASFNPGGHCTYAPASLDQESPDWTLVSPIGFFDHPSLCRITPVRWASQLLHKSSPLETYAAAAPIPIPMNVDAAETTRFSPQRSRDISSNLTQASSSQNITPNCATKCLSGLVNTNFDADFHVQSYDCYGSISLYSVMQSNVPTPFAGIHKISHLHMPGGQWSQEYKFTSLSMQNFHYTCLRDNTRADWADSQGFSCGSARRSYTTRSTPPSTSLPTSNLPIQKTAPVKFSKKEQLRKAFKEYGSTIVVFHVCISLISVLSFYALVSSGVNMISILEFLGVPPSATAEKISTGSSFVIAYAVHKVFAPIRISITLAATPFIVRYLRLKGFLKNSQKNT
ncbi:uncharacterized protein LOC26514318 isoform X3 [Drosophila ananassae]|uniref:uncharacterized protein LOC26514318 isoform X3 n=1 Tax=Drosophila ananassae TaxID=7217 RepID=UPI0013A5D090|nr:uncharacterized protein LOC26514318 isoform X3 [Drosophila ananassae]